jgi:hypothetical protein
MRRATPAVKIASWSVAPRHVLVRARDDVRRDGDAAVVAPWAMPTETRTRPSSRRRIPDSLPSCPGVWACGVVYA